VASGDFLDVFVYRDSEDRLVCTPQTPRAQVGECAFLEAVSFQPGVGIFLDWGLEKDLLLPLREQAHSVATGERVLVYVAIDERSDRIIATMRLRRHIHTTPARFFPGQEVSLLVADETPMGYRCIVAHSHFGMLYHSEIHTPLAMGEARQGFVREVRADGKIDLRLDRSGYRRVAPLAEIILGALEKAGGHLPLHDGSDPALIRETFGCSKKAFKQAVGSLLKERRIVLGSDGLLLAKNAPPAPNTPKPSPRT
jgi:predicted RNA-binding protein (virulence factor B family)